MITRMDKTLVERIRKHAERSYPHECCGALMGIRENGLRLVADVMPLNNRRVDDAATRRYLVSAKDYRVIEGIARHRSLEVVGFYHSHPDHPAVPSEFDREHALPWYGYFIISVNEGRSGDVACWRLSEDRSRFDSETLTNGAQPDTIKARGDRNGR